MSGPMRKHLRYKPEKLETALIMFDGERNGWHPDECALIIDESAVAGAQLIVKFTDRLQPASKVKVKLGQLEPLLGEVAWRKEVAADLCRIGVRFLE